MITDFILGAVFSGINALLSLMPAFTISPPGNTWSQLIYDIGQVNNIVPMLAIFTVASMLIGLRVALTVWDFILFVYHQFWGSD